MKQNCFEEISRRISETKISWMGSEGISVRGISKRGLENSLMGITENIYKIEVTVKVCVTK